jgi:hypothetical protein
MGEDGLAHRAGQSLEVDQLDSAMSDKTHGARLPGDLVDQLEADRDRYLASLSPEASRELVERVAAPSCERGLRDLLDRSGRLRASVAQSVSDFVGLGRVS